MVWRMCRARAVPTQRQCNVDFWDPCIPAHIWGWGPQHPRSSNASLFLLLSQFIPLLLPKSGPLSCIFVCACMRFPSPWKPNSPFSKSSRLCQRASTDLLSSYFQHVLFRRSAMTAPLSLLARRLWRVSRSESQHARRHLIRQRANPWVSWAHRQKQFEWVQSQSGLATQV